MRKLFLSVLLVFSLSINSQHLVGYDFDDVMEDVYEYPEIEHYTTRDYNNYTYLFLKEGETVYSHVFDEYETCVATYLFPRDNVVMLLWETTFNADKNYVKKSSNLWHDVRRSVYIEKGIDEGEIYFAFKSY